MGMVLKSAVSWTPAGHRKGACNIYACLRDGQRYDVDDRGVIEEKVHENRQIQNHCSHRTHEIEVPIDLTVYDSTPRAFSVKYLSHST